MRQLKEIANTLKPMYSSVRKYFVIMFFLNLIQVPVTILTTFCYKVFVDDVLLEQKLSKLIIVVSWYVGSALFVLFVKYLYVKLENKFLNTINMNMRQRIFRNYITMPFSVFEKYSIGDLKFRMDDDLKCIELFIKDFVMSNLLFFLQIIGLVIIMCVLNLKLFLFTMFVIPVTFILGDVIGKGEMKIQEDIRKVSNEKDQWMFYSMQNWKEIKAMNLQKKEKIRFVRFYHKLGLMNAKWIVFWMLQDLIVPMIKDEFVMKYLLYLIGGYLVIHGDVTIGTLLVFVNYYNTFYELLNRMNTYFIEYRNNLPMIRRAIHMLNMEEKEKSGFTGELKGNITVNNLCYQYEGSDKNVLSNISFDIEKGNMVAVVGPSGVGKTTLIKLLGGVLKKSSGSILFDGRNIDEIDSDTIFKNISIVMQDSQLFNLSIRENLIFGNRDVSDEQLDDICEQVNLKEFVHSLPQQYDTVIGEAGLKLSGGQRQRLVLARMLLSNSKIYILDEATSSLDNESDNLIHKTLRAKGKDTTIIIIAHRFSSIVKADKVLVLGKGKVMGYDSHENLRASNSAYNKLFWKNQENVEVDYAEV